MSCGLKWTPFLKQMLVVFGASVNISQIQMSIGYTAILLPQLKKPDSPIRINENSASWIASALGATLILGNILNSIIIGKFGRVLSGLIVSSMSVLVWIMFTLATNVTTLILIRCLQGLNVGMVIIHAPIILGEYTSPKNRAAFSSLSTCIGCLGILAVHTIGSYLSWQATALVCAIFSFVGLLTFMLSSPESPSWLADQGRYDESEKNFRWMRGNDDEDELQQMLKASRLTQESKRSTSSNTVKVLAKKIKMLLPRREFYIPLFVMFHLYNIVHWCGLVLISAYIKDYIDVVIGPDVDFGVQITLMNLTRLVSNAFGVYITKISKRRVLIGTSVGLNIVLLFLISAYAYAKLNKWLPFDHPLIGISLLHIILMTISIGASPISVIISSEIFPLEFRSLLGGISACFYSVCFFIAIKIIPIALKKYGMHGIFLIYGLVMTYCLIATLMFCPETKNRTLKDIEDELRGKQMSRNEDQSAVPLNSLNS